MSYLAWRCRSASSSAPAHSNALRIESRFASSAEDDRAVTRVPIVVLLDLAPNDVSFERQLSLSWMRKGWLPPLRELRCCPSGSSNWIGDCCASETAAD